MKPCIVCGEPSEASRCDEHRRAQENARESRRNVEHPAYGNRTRWKNASRRARAAQPFCLDCGATDQLTVDHILPFRERPDLAYAQDNLAVLCRPCNARKGDTMPDADAVAAVEAAVAARRARRTRGDTPAGDACRRAGEAQSQSLFLERLDLADTGPLGCAVKGDLHAVGLPHIRVSIPLIPGLVNDLGDTERFIAADRIAVSSDPAREDGVATCRGISVTEVILAAIGSANRNVHVETMP